jgi:hypothetical protein
MPLALDDATLVRVVIAVPPAERKAWLMKFAERAEPKS